MLGSLRTREMLSNHCRSTGTFFHSGSILEIEKVPERVNRYEGAC
jgi:hypothetical protein